MPEGSGGGAIEDGESLVPRRGSGKIFFVAAEDARRAGGQPLGAEVLRGRQQQQAAPSREYSRLSRGISMSVKICKPARALRRFRSTLLCVFPGFPCATPNKI